MQKIVPMPTSSIEPPTCALPLPEDGLLQLKDVLLFIRVGKSTWWKWVQDGIAPEPCRKIGTMTFWRAADIRAFIAGEESHG